MKIRFIKVFKYQIPFIRPLKIFSHTLSKRIGFIVKVTDQNNFHHFGEVAPLSPISCESLDEAYKQLIGCCIKLKKNEKIDYSILHPSVLFGILSALRENSSNSLRISYSRLLYHNFKIGDIQTMQNTYKLKLSNLSVKKACILVKMIKQKFPNLKLRLDINQRWSYSDALYFLDNFQPGDFEYIEEPCKAIDETKKILKTTFHKIALDESLKNWTLSELEQYENIKALIIKPSIINFTKYLALKIPLVFSSSFETGIGLINIAKLAKMHSTKVAGLDTSKFLEYDVLKRPLIFAAEMNADLLITLNENSLRQCFTV